MRAERHFDPSLKKEEGEKKYISSYLSVESRKRKIKPEMRLKKIEKRKRTREKLKRKNADVDVGLKNPWLNVKNLTDKHKWVLRCLE